MGNINDIINGHINELFNNNEELFESRMNICKKCPLYKETSVGPICNPKLYINEIDKESVSSFPKVNYKRGCSCRLNAKVRVIHAKCIVNKW